MNTIIKIIFVLMTIQSFSQTIVHSKRYDNFNRLIEASDGTNTVTYTYDELGNRTQQQITVETLSTDEVAFAGLELYPNPTAKMLSVKAKEIITVSKLYDPQGKLIRSNTNDQKEIQMDISHLSNGVYHLVIFSNDKKHTFTVIKK
ncbi:T9SS type A sorting domain-containing protein [Aquimarina rhabdastrellae]